MPGPWPARRSPGSGGPSVRETPEDLVAQIPGLADYTRVREDTVTALLESVRGAVGVPVSLILMGDRLSTGADPVRVASTADCVELMSYTTDADRTGDVVSAVVPHLRSLSQLVVGLQAFPPASPDAGTLLANVARAAELGVNRFSFYNYGIMPAGNLQWVRRAIRTSTD